MSLLQFGLTNDFVGVIRTPIEWRTKEINKYATVKNKKWRSK
jgi:hypothetical protein